jgi:glucan phosphoethanolaminetransferase (alkaline phosphatase superfamily)
MLSGLFLTGNILTFDGKTEADIMMNIKGVWQVTGTGYNAMIRTQFPALVILVSILLLSVVTIFFYTKRKIQMKLTLGIIVMIIAFVGILLFYTFAIINKYQVSLVPGWKMFIPFLMLLFGILAYRGIKKDEELVKSYDRLR